MSQIMEKELRWTAELKFLPHTLTKDQFRLYFEGLNYNSFKDILENTSGNKTDIYSKKLNHHTLVMIKEALLDDEYVNCLEQVNIALYDWDMKIKCSVDGKDIPFSFLNYSVKEKIATDIMENGKIAGIEYDKFKVLEHRENLYVNSEFRMDLEEKEDNSYSYTIYSDNEEYVGLYDNIENKPLYQVAADICDDFRSVVLPQLDEILLKQQHHVSVKPEKVKFEELEF